MLDRVILRAAKHAPALYLTGKQETSRIEIDDVYYIEAVRSNVVYHTKNGDVAIPGSLAEEKQRLPKGVFAQCNRRVIVHLGYVTKVMGNNVFAGGASFVVGNRKAEFMQKLLAYMDRR